MHQASTPVASNSIGESCDHGVRRVTRTCACVAGDVSVRLFSNVTGKIQPAELALAVACGTDGCCDVVLAPRTAPGDGLALMEPAQSNEGEEAPRAAQSLIEYVFIDDKGRLESSSTLDHLLQPPLRPEQCAFVTSSRSAVERIVSSGAIAILVAGHAKCRMSHQTCPQCAKEAAAAVLWKNTPTFVARTLVKAFEFVEANNYAFFPHTEAPTLATDASGHKKQDPAFVIEVEQKFTVADNSAHRLKAWLASVGCAAPRHKTFVDTYFDTPAFSLMSRDHWLRQRGEKWELKVPTKSSIQDDGHAAERGTVPTVYTEVIGRPAIEQFLHEHFGITEPMAAVRAVASIETRRTSVAFQ